MSLEERIERSMVEIMAEKEAEEEIKSQPILHKVTFFILLLHKYMEGKKCNTVYFMDMRSKKKKNDKKGELKEKSMKYKKKVWNIKHDCMKEEYLTK